MHPDDPKVYIEGIYRDRLIDASGSVTQDSGWKKNLIVLRCRILLAAFLRNDTALGIRSLKVGRGNSSWDDTPPPLADPVTTIGLADPSPYTMPIADLTLEYLNDNDGVVVTPTNRIQITATLGHNTPPSAAGQPYQLREFGLFGNLNGTDFMIDYIRHPLIEKDAAVTLERRVRLVL